MTTQELKNEIFAAERPPRWRLGQFVFNYIDDIYGVARHVQFIDRVDCFYNDDNIDLFIEHAAKYITEIENSTNNCKNNL